MAEPEGQMRFQHIPDPTVIAPKYDLVEEGAGAGIPALVVLCLALLAMCIIWAGLMGR